MKGAYLKNHETLKDKFNEIYVTLDFLDHEKNQVLSVTRTQQRLEIELHDEKKKIIQKEAEIYLKRNFGNNENCFTYIKQNEKLPFISLNYSNAEKYDMLFNLIFSHNEIHEQEEIMIKIQDTISRKKNRLNELRFEKRVQEKVKLPIMKTTLSLHELRELEKRRKKRTFLEQVMEPCLSLELYHEIQNQEFFSDHDNFFIFHEHEKVSLKYFFDHVMVPELFSFLEKKKRVKCPKCEFEFSLNRKINFFLEKYSHLKQEKEVSFMEIKNLSDDFLMNFEDIRNFFVSHENVMVHDFNTFFSFCKNPFYEQENEPLDFSIEEEINKWKVILYHQDHEEKHETKVSDEMIKQAETEVSHALEVQKLFNESVIEYFNSYLKSISCFVNDFLHDVFNCDFSLEIHLSIKRNINSISYKIKKNKIKFETENFKLLSGGEYDKLSLAFCFAFYFLFHDKKRISFLIFDECLNSLDIESKKNFFSYLKKLELQGKNTFSFLVCHDENLFY